MNSKLSTNGYIVYKHTSPSNKVYIGITKYVVERRWESGWGYKDNIYFFKAIVKYGWINFKHEILFEGLTKEEAEEKEIELIAQYKSFDKNFGYNLDFGGFLHLQYDKIRKNLKKFNPGLLTAERNRIKNIKYVPKTTGRKVYKYDLEGNLLDTFDTCKEAAKDAGVPYPSFQRWIRGKHPKYALFKYSYGAFDDAKDKKYTKTYNAKPVDMFDISMHLVRTFPSITEAGLYIGNLLGIKATTARSNIHGVCCGAHNSANSVRLTAYNYIWRYHNEN